MTNKIKTMVFYDVLRTYTETSQGIQLHVTTWFDEKKSDFLLKSFTHIFSIRIENDRDDDVRLMRMRWIIQETGFMPRLFESEGINGRLPVIASATTFAYDVLVPFQAPNLLLKGSYIFQPFNQSGIVEVKTPSFFIAAHIFN